MKRTRRSFGSGMLVGACGALAVAVAMGAGGRFAAGYFVTSSADGRSAYLWEAEGGALRFVAASESIKGRGGEQGKGEDGKPQGVEDGGKGKGKERERSKAKD